MIVHASLILICTYGYHLIKLELLQVDFQKVISVLPGWCCKKEVGYMIDCKEIGRKINKSNKKYIYCINNSMIIHQSGITL